jgi:xylan 1,4-beta-xylosidase
LETRTVLRIAHSTKSQDLETLLMKREIRTEESELATLGGTRHIRPARLAAMASLGLATLLAGQVANAADVTITVDAGKSVSGNPHFWSTCVGTGTASLTLRPDLQTHYKLGQRELGFERVRGHGVLNDDMGIYKADGNHDWSKYDTYLAAITAAKMVPLMELSFMPKALASSGNDRNPPKDYAAYQKFIQAVVQHTVDKMGKEEVSKWYWEVWNEWNYSGFWTGTGDDYNKLYAAAEAGATAVLPEILIGGPVTTQGSVSQMTAFLDYVKKNDLRVTFLSSHAYCGGEQETADANFAVSDNDERLGVISKAGLTIPSFNSEWNSSYSGQGGSTAANVMSMDTHANAPFILKTVKLMADKTVGDKPAAQIFSYWAMSDVFDEYGGAPLGSYILGKTANGTLPFGSVFGLTTFQGMRKAAFNGFKMLNYLGEKRLGVTGGTGTKDGVDGMAAVSADGSQVQIIVYNYYAKVLTTGTDNVTVNVDNLPFAGKEAYITRYAIDEKTSNPYSVWVSQNKPSAPTEANWQAMRKAQHLMPVEDVAKKTMESKYTATFAIPKQGASMIILSLKRPLTGRDAKVEIEGEDYDGQSGVTKEDSGDESMGQSISAAANSWAYFENVDYTDEGVDTVQLRVKNAAETSVELRSASETGTSLGKCTLPASSAWATQTCKLSAPVAGVSKLYLMFAGATRLNWLKFSGAGGTPTGGTGGNSGTATSGAAGTTGTGTGTGGAGGKGGTGGGTTSSSGSGGASGGTKSGGTSGGAGQSSSSVAGGGSSGSSSKASGGSSQAGGSSSGGKSASSSSSGSGSSGGSSGQSSAGSSGKSSSGAALAARAAARRGRSRSSVCSSACSFCADVTTGRACPNYSSPCSRRRAGRTTASQAPAERAGPARNATTDRAPASQAAGVRAANRASAGPGRWQDRAARQASHPAGARAAATRARRGRQARPAMGARPAVAPARRAARPAPPGRAARLALAARPAQPAPAAQPARPGPAARLAPQRAGPAARVRAERAAPPARAARPARPQPSPWPPMGPALPGRRMASPPRRRAARPMSP